MNITHYAVYTKVREYTPEYYRVREIIEKFPLRFHIGGSFHHLTVSDEAISLDTLKDAVQQAIGPEGFCYVAELAGYYKTPTLDTHEEVPHPDASSD